MAKYDLIDNPVREMSTNIKKAAALLACYSPSYEESEYCMREVNFAYGQAKRPIIPVRIKNFKPGDELAFIIEGPKRFDFTTPDQISKNLDGLIKLIKEKYQAAMMYV